MRVGLLGAWSIDNAGDTVLALASLQALRRHVPGAEPVLLSPSLPAGFWNHRWTEVQGHGLPIRPVPADAAVDWAEDLDALVIGGGGLVDPEPTFRPFLLGDPDRFPARVPAAWNAVGSQNRAWYLGTPGADVVRRAAERLAWCAVRNRSTERYLRRIGVTRPIEVVPDAAIGLEVPPEVDDRVDALLAELGLEHREGRRLVGISVGRAVTDPRTTDFFRGLVATLAELAAAGPVDLLVFPFGGIYGDPALQAPVARALRPAGARVLETTPPPLVLWRLIARLDLYVCTRLHATIAAWTQNTPFLVLDEYLSNETATSKIRELVVDAGLEAHYLSPFLSRSPAWKVHALWERLDTIDFRPDVARARADLEAHHRGMFAALGLV